MIRIFTKSIKRASQIFLFFALILCSTIKIAIAGSDSISSTEDDLKVKVISFADPKRVIVTFDSISILWKSDVDFVDTSWTYTEGLPGGVGYDRDGDYDQFISVNVFDYMYRGNPSCFIRIPFTIEDDVLKELDYLSLRLKYDDGFIAYINGHAVANANLPDILTWYSGARQPHEALGFRSYDISHHLDKRNSILNQLCFHQ